ncbi:hypothetical protein [Amycolatopsis sp. H20-H5]|nr:hypothetical protein [Amycolatopsis sp. H20-H5]MEC3975226.1 hypothetical protein [Amycolatopsis sp. H20-H5]
MNEILDNEAFVDSEDIMTRIIQEQDARLRAEERAWDWADTKAG